MTMPQHMEALQRANEVRLERAAIKKQLKAGELSLEELLDDTPACLDNVEIGDLIAWMHRYGPQRVNRVLMDPVTGRPIIGRHIPLWRIGAATRERLIERVADTAYHLAA